MAVSKDDVIGAYLEGVDAIESRTARFAPDVWAKPTPCEGWTAEDLAAHVRTAAARYHAFLDSALAGERRLLVPLAEMDRINSEEMDALPPASGHEHVIEFARLARAYADRVRDAWDVPIGIMDAYIPAGTALGVEALEFNVHAWDFARVLDEDYRPERAQVIFDVAARAFVLSKARYAQRAAGVLQAGIHPLVRRLSGDPWRSVLKRMGRLD